MFIDYIIEGSTLQFLLTCSALVVGAVKASKLTVEDKMTTVNTMVDIAIATGNLDPDDQESVDLYRDKVSESIDDQYKTVGTRTNKPVDSALTRARGAFIDSLKSDGIEQIKPASGSLQAGVYRMTDGIFELGITRHQKNEDGSKYTPPEKVASEDKDGDIGVLDMKGNRLNTD
jgi:hypothetical protein